MSLHEKQETCSKSIESQENWHNVVDVNLLCFFPLCNERDSFVSVFQGCPGIIEGRLKEKSTLKDKHGHDSRTNHATSSWKIDKLMNSSYLVMSATETTIYWIHWLNKHGRLNIYTRNRVSVAWKKEWRNGKYINTLVHEDTCFMSIINTRLQN